MSAFTEVSQLSNGNLLIKLSATGKRELSELLQRYKTQEYYSFFVDLFEEGAGTSSIFGNGHHFLSDDDKFYLGILTDSIVLGYGAIYDSHNDDALIDFEKTWWFPDYQIVCPIKELLTKGQVTFTLSK